MKFQKMKREEREREWLGPTLEGGERMIRAREIGPKPL
jgi:hypothetical protein